MPRRDLSFIDALDFLTALGTRNVSRSGDEISFSCPSANHAHGDSNPSAGMNARTTLWRCRSAACGLRGDAVTYLTSFHGLNASEAQRVIDERYGGPEIGAEAGGLSAEVDRILSAAEEEPDRILPSEEWLEIFRVDWFGDPIPYMLERGFSPQTLIDWQIGWDPNYRRIAIPIRDENGLLVGFKGRAIDDRHPRYIAIGDAAGRPEFYGFQTYRKSEVVFGLDRAQGDRAVICEGEFNALMLHQHGEHGAVGVAGSELSADQAQLIIERFSSAVVYFDADDAGKHGTRTVIEALSPYMPVCVVADAPDDAAALGADAVSLIASAIPSLTLAITATKM